MRRLLRRHTLRYTKLASFRIKYCEHTLRSSHYEPRNSLITAEASVEPNCEATGVLVEGGCQCYRVTRILDDWSCVHFGPPANSVLGLDLVFGGGEDIRVINGMFVDWHRHQRTQCGWSLMRHFTLQYLSPTSREWMKSVISWTYSLYNVFRYYAR
jgi:hypothetical protein